MEMISNQATIKKINATSQLAPSTECSDGLVLEEIKNKCSATNNSEEIAHRLNVKVRQQRKQNKTGRGLTESEVALVVSRTKAVVEIKSFILSILVSSTDE